jgi:hypothetical protein
VVPRNVRGEHAQKLVIYTSVSGTNVWLVPYDQNTGGKFSIKVGIDVDIQRSLAGRSSRRPQAILPRFSVSWDSYLDQNQFNTLRNATIASQDEPILVPLWPHLYYPNNGESPTVTSSLIVAWNDGWGTWAINPGSYASYTYAAPLVWGRLSQPPRLVSSSGALVSAQFEVYEDAPATYALSVPSGILPADTLTASTGGTNYPNFPFLPDWSDAPEPEIATYDVERTVIGPGRMRATVYYSQTPERIFSANFTGFTRNDAAQFIAWWIRRQGQAGPHWVPLASFGIINGETVLARHTDTALTIDYSGWNSTLKLGWREVAPENNPPSDETIGTTIGLLPAGAWMFQIDLDYNGGIQSWYLTNWEGGITANSQAWTYNACDFDKLVRSIDLEDDSGSVKFRYFAGGPWDNWLPGQLAARGYMTIFRADVSPGGTATNFQQIWKGELITPNIDGPLVDQRAMGANAIFGRKVPRQLMSTACGTMLFRTRCGVSQSAYTFTATIATVSGNQVSVGSFGGTLPSGFGALNWFALGWMGWTVGSLPFRSSIIASGAILGGDVALTLDRAPGLSVGTSVTVVPGCNRLYGDGCLKFNNQTNFRGFPYMPAVSPNFIIPQQNQTPAKK